MNDELIKQVTEMLASTPKKCSAINLRVSQAEKALLQIKAKSAGLSLSQYIRTLLFHNAKNA